MPEHQSNTAPDSASAAAEDTLAHSSEAPLEGLSVSEPEDALPRVTLDDLPADMRAACARAGWQ
ncbi:ATP-dependent helicase, partial [Desulfovibrio sp. 1214_IL3152]